MWGACACVCVCVGCVCMGVHVWGACAWVCMCGMCVHVWGGCACVGCVCLCVYMCGMGVHVWGACACVWGVRVRGYVHVCGACACLWGECMSACTCAWECGGVCVWGYWAYLQCSTSQMPAVTGFSPHECLDLCPVRTSLTVVTDVSLRSETKHFPCVKAFVVYPFLGIVFHILCSFFC